MEKEIISKRMFLLLAMICIVPALLFFIRVFVLGSGQYLPLAIFSLIGVIACVLVAYYFFRKKYLLKVG